MKTRFLRLFIFGLALVILTLVFVQWYDARSDRTPIQPVDVAMTSAPSAASNSDKNRAYRPASFEEVTESGQLLSLSGRAEAGSTLSILDGSAIRETFEVPGNGRWSREIAIVKDEIMEITLAMSFEPGFKVMSDETVYRIPFPPVAALQMGMDAPQALILLTTPGGASQAVQSPFSQAPKRGPLTLGPIDYDDMGSVIFSGTSDVPGRVRIYVAGNAIGDTRVADDGRWYYIRADTLSVGKYPIAAELTPREGEPVRITVPMERLSPDEANAPDETYVKFEPRRWQLRRALRGGGGQYTVILPNILPLPQPNVSGEDAAER